MSGKLGRCGGALLLLEETGARRISRKMEARREAFKLFAKVER